MIRSTMKRILVGVLSAAMVLGSAISVSAAPVAKSGAAVTVNGESNVLSHGALEISNVMLPTTTVTTGNIYSASALNFTLDPGRIIPKIITGAVISDTALAAGVTEAGVYFLQSDKVYHSTSTALKVTNKSSFEIELELKAVLTGGTIDLATSKGVSATTKEALYMGFIVKTGTSAAGATNTVTDVALSGTTKTIPVKLGTVDDNFKYKGYGDPMDLDGNYYAELTENPAANTGAWINAFFNLEGACGQFAGDTTKTAPNVDLTWSWKAVGTESAAAEAAPSIATTEYSYTKNTTLSVPVSMGSGDLKATDISKVAFADSKNGTYTAWEKGTKWKVEGGNLKLISVFGSISSGTVKYVKVTFNDSAATAVILKITIA